MNAINTANKLSGEFLLSLPIEKLADIVLRQQDELMSAASEKEYILKVRLLSDASQLPCYAHQGDAGLDLFSVKNIIIQSGESALIPTGISIQLPPNTEAQIRPRSGLAYKHQVTVLNTPGTIDEGYRGEIGVILINHGKLSFQVAIGMKIAQMVIKPILKVRVERIDELDTTTRGEGGFGSTGV